MPYGRRMKNTNYRPQLTGDGASLIAARSLFRLAMVFAYAGFASAAVIEHDGGEGRWAARRRPQACRISAHSLTTFSRRPSLLAFNFGDNIKA